MEWEEVGNAFVGFACPQLLPSAGIGLCETCLAYGELHLGWLFALICA